MVQTQSQASGKNANCVEEGTCFIAGTLIQTVDGVCAIEEIKEGMLVYAADPESGELGLRRVVNTFKKTTNELIHVSVNGEEIVTTPTHPFWRPKHGWTKAVELRAGDILLTSNGEYVVVEQVQHEILEAPVEVYNFEVEDFHTYYVGVSSVLVHNKCSGSYEIQFESGKNYVGKGNKDRMNVSARTHSVMHNDPVVSKHWDPAPDRTAALMDEYFKMMVRGVNNPNTYNQIWSPGRKIFMDYIQRRMMHLQKPVSNLKMHYNQGERLKV